jgi:hypothetical protein
MVTALLSGAKSQTRRLVGLDTLQVSSTPGYDLTFRGQAPVRSIAQQLRKSGGCWQDMRMAEFLALCPYGVPGDRLWVRETCIIAHKDFPDFKDPSWPRDNDGVPRVVQYLASHPDREHAADYGYSKATPSIHMPRWASRITLEITDVRVEQLTHISEDDARAEGVTPDAACIESRCARPHRDRFFDLWDEINGKRCPWRSSPWVWVLEFRRVDQSAERLCTNA